MTDEQRFDQMLTDQLTDLPPEGPDVEWITPWRMAMRRVVVGLGLTTVTLNFLYLQYLLPAIGVLFLWQGFRTLRRENRWLRLCWLLSLVRLVLFFLTTVRAATVYYSLDPWNWATYTGAFLNLILYFALWRGLLAVQVKAGQPASAPAAGALVIWYCCLFPLAWINLTGWLAVLPILIIYIVILRQLARLPALLDHSGYVVHAAPVRLSDGWAGILWGAALVISLIAASALLCRYPMTWTPADPNEQAGLGEIRDHLAELGYPEEALADLSADDLAACDGALSVTVDISEEPMNNGRRVTSTNGNVNHVSTVYDVYELKLTSVAVELPGQEWRIFHHFLWQDEPDLRTTESILLWTAYHDRDDWLPSGELSGRLLYDREGVTYTGAYYLLEESSYSYDTLFFGTTSGRDPVAAFSLPLRGDRCRGYVAYGALELEEEHLLNSWINYTHQVGSINYPFRSALETELGGYLFDDLYRTAQSAIQFYPGYDQEE